jgi:hypothetical protein
MLRGGIWNLSFSDLALMLGMEFGIWNLEIGN